MAIAASGFDSDGQGDKRYRIVRELTRSATGVVLEAFDPVLERPVALKVLSRQLASDPGFIREATASSRLHHPNIAALFDLVDMNGSYYLVSELVDGQTLGEILQSKTRSLTVNEAMEYLDPVARALTYAHSEGVVHSDIRPSNVVVRKSDELVKVMNFGIAQMEVQSSLTQPGDVLEWLRYISPEQIRGDETGPPTDLYSLGVTLYEMLTGTRPFDADNGARLMQMHLQEMPTQPSVLNQDIPSHIDAAIVRCLAKDPRDRIQTVPELLQAIRTPTRDA